MPHPKHLNSKNLPPRGKAEAGPAGEDPGVRAPRRPARRSQAPGRIWTVRATALPRRAREHPPPGTPLRGDPGGHRGPAPARERAADTHPLGITVLLHRNARGAGFSRPRPPRSQISSRTAAGAVAAIGAQTQAAGDQNPWLPPGALGGDRAEPQAHAAG